MVAEIMSLSQEQIKVYREKLNDPGYMKTVISGVADKISQVIIPESIPEWIPKINMTEGKMKNKAIDLHNILFEQLERLNDLDEEELKNEKLVNEIKRSEAMTKLASQLIGNGRLVLDGIKVALEAPERIELPEMLSTRALPAPKQDGKK
jgi:hypothetical protein